MEVRHKVCPSVESLLTCLHSHQAVCCQPDILPAQFVQLAAPQAGEVNPVYAEMLVQIQRIFWLHDISCIQRTILSGIIRFNDDCKLSMDEATDPTDHQHALAAHPTPALNEGAMFRYCALQATRSSLSPHEVPTCSCKDFQLNVRSPCRTKSAEKI